MMYWYAARPPVGVFAIMLVALVACSKPTSQEEARERNASPTAADGGATGAAQLEGDAPPAPESPAQPSDSDIERSISAALLGDARTASAVHQIDVDVAAGIAVLSGTAQSQEQADVAELLVSKVPGVTRVENYIVIETPPGKRLTSPPPSDADILATVRQALGADTTIEIAVDDGVVTLGGIANSEEVRSAAAIARAAGAREVVDQTRLVPLEITP